jgi:hypothetical protein
VRIGATAAAGFQTLRFADSRAYLGAANVLVTTGSYPDRTDALFFRAPGYPVFLAAVTLGHPERIAAAKIAGAASAALVPLLLAALSARLFQSRAVALATGLAAALHPSFVLIAADIQSETVFLPLLLGAAYLLLAATDRPSTSLALGAGLLLATAALVRPTALALAPFLLAPLRDRRYPLRARAHLAGAAALGFAAALAPWTARNALMFHEFIPVSDSAGSSFFDGNTGWTSRLYAARTRAEFEDLVLQSDRDKRARLAALGPEASASPGRRSSALVRLAVEERRRDPAGTARLYAHKIWQWLRPYPTPLYWPASIVIGIGLLYTALYAAAAAGLATAHRRGAASFCLAVLAVTMASHVALLVLWRYRVPYWDPVLLLYGVFAAGYKLPTWKRSS